MESSTLLKLLAPYEPKEHRAGYITFYCPDCQPSGEYRRTRQGYVYTYTSRFLRCSNTSKCGWSQSISGEELGEYFEQADCISAWEHPFWSSFLANRNLSQETIEKYSLCVFTDLETAPHRSLYERLCFPVYTLTGQFVGYTARAKDRDTDPRYFHFLLENMDEFIGYGVHCYQPGDKTILVEGPLDVLAAWERNQTAAIGCLGSNWSTTRLKAICGWKPTELILGMDNDEAGVDSTLNVLRYLGEQAPDLWHYVLSFPEDIKDVSELQTIGKYTNLIFSETWLEGRDVVAEEFYPYNPKKLSSILHISLEAAESRLKAFHESRRMKTTYGQIQKATTGVQSLLNQGKVQEAVKTLKTIDLPQESNIKPITGDSLIAQISIAEPLGLRNGWLTRLDHAFQGFRGLCFIGGAPGVGKTILASQLAAGLLTQNLELFCVFLSLELNSRSIALNMSAAANAYQGNLSEIASRLFVYESLPFTHVNDLITLLKQKEQETGLRSCLILDRIQLLDAAAGTDLYRDEKRYDWITQIRDAIYPNPVIAISELAKVNWGSGWLGMEAFKGSGRGGHAADQAMIITPLTDSQLYANISLTSGGYQTKDKFIHSTKVLNDDEMSTVGLLREVLLNQQKDYQVIHIPKAREGMRMQIPVTNFYHERFYRESFT